MEIRPDNPVAEGRRLHHKEEFSVERGRKILTELKLDLRGV